MSNSEMQDQWSSSPLYAGNLTYIEGMFEDYLADPQSVGEYWQEFFGGLAEKAGVSDIKDVNLSQIREAFQQLMKQPAHLRASAAAPASGNTEHERKQVRVTHIIQAYRIRGHQQADLDPLGLMYREQVSDLDLEHHGLSGADMDTVFHTGTLFIGKDQATLKEILECLKATYCSSIGAEYMHVVNTAEKRWWQEKLETVRSKPRYENETKLHILERLTAAEGLEKALASKFPGYKRFGLEGGEALIPLLDEVIQGSGKHKAREIVIGMAHRGRLNVLVNTFGKKPSELFDEFQGKKIAEVGSGDVKYHQGFSSNVMTPGGEVHLALAFNPSHLEIVAPVVQGSVRARQDRRNDVTHSSVVPVVIHGDAAFAGQGVVMETLQMSQTRAYKTGGTIHVIINNQVGFTTSRQDDARSTEYCTDVAKMVQSPILHVNGDDPEAVYFAAQLAVEYRMAFNKDVVIDLVCYRKHGHNETDEPSGTQPLMYAVIKKHKSVRDLFAKKLVDAKVLDTDESKKMVAEYRQLLEQGNHVVKSLVREPNKELFIDWTPYIGHGWIPYAETGVKLEDLRKAGEKALRVPEGFTVQKQVQKVIDDRNAMLTGDQPLNWGAAEILCYATLLQEGHPIRFTGQDCGRGTFSHRYAVLHDQKTANTHIPLKHIDEDMPFDMYDSFLSEEAVLAFEYGYATTRPQGLVIWEAQFGDFANGAQVVIDQFISSGEHKWSRVCGLVLLLPHGYEGQGPEHSSARLERFLQLCAEQNMQVCVPSTPAQIFHLLRRQAIRPLRKPLVIMSPKSLLRHKACTSTLEDLQDQTFNMVLPEADSSINADQVERVIMCSGRVYYDLLEHRTENDLKNTAIIRIEQLYPFPEEELQAELSKFKNLSSVVWCQEEPMNQGAWYPTQHHMRKALFKVNKDIDLEFAGRAPAAAPAVGYPSIHAAQQKELIEDAFSHNQDVMVKINGTSKY
ncbi:MAG: 2-oxoglutarate dehydrogenase E1 component [Pseudomonadota bacterium]|nr:2-oxoglutarate dehydrogenase E1 component [Gammaproteobacteria bacterium]MEC8009231.1 2-oxoglutarate dehydrogenase E1 component [Pseudomonadota bacterium]|tara:strand:- start:6235 stop:9120 length:2886 start_codon:yes stop_codon:yes gene_type:complete